MHNTRSNPGEIQPLPRKPLTRLPRRLQLVLTDDMVTGFNLYRHYLTRILRLQLLGQPPINLSPFCDHALSLRGCTSSRLHVSPSRINRPLYSITTREHPQISHALPSVRPAAVA